MVRVTKRKVFYIQSILGSSLKKLSYLHLKDAEKCYIEAIKHFPNNKEFNFEARLLKVQSKVKM